MNTDNQILLVVDENDNFIRYEKRGICHFGKGVHHRAFVVLLENSKGDVLLQRKHKLFDNLWDTTAISHPLHNNDQDETYEEAGNRALKTEMGIEFTKLSKIGGFNYYVPHGDNCENEYCAILTGVYNGNVIPNPDAVYDYKWVPKHEFISKSITHDPSYTPWAILTGEFLSK